MEAGAASEALAGSGKTQKDQIKSEIGTAELTIKMAIESRRDEMAGIEETTFLIFRETSPSSHNVNSC